MWGPGEGLGESPVWSIEFRLWVGRCDERIVHRRRGHICTLGRELWPQPGRERAREKQVQVLAASGSSGTGRG